MSSISTIIDVRQLDAQNWRILTSVSYTGPLSNSETIVVPKGFVTDFASTPDFMWSLGMPKSGIYDPAAVVHDYLYVTAGKVQGTSMVFPKATADLIFKDALQLLGVGSFKAWAMWKAVSLFGKGNYATAKK